MWDINNGNCLRTFIGHHAYVCSLAVASDGRQFAAGAADGAVRSWDLNCATVLHALHHGADDAKVCYHAESDRLITGGADGVFRIWAPSGRCDLEVRAHDAPILKIASVTLASRSRIPYGPLKHTPAVQYGIAEMYVGVEAARALVRRSARRLSDPGWRDASALALAIATKHFATRQAIRVVDQALETVGGGAFFKKLPFERFYRDVRAGGFHPVSGYDALEVIGKAELGIPDTHKPRFV